MTEPVGQSPTIDEQVDHIEAVLHPRGRCETCGGGEAYWKHTLNNTDYHQFRATVRPPGDEAGLRAALGEAWEYGHRAGIGCGHDLAVCHHDDTTLSAEIDDLASWNEPVRAALAAKPDQEEPGLDVERLVRALYRVERGDVLPTTERREAYRRQKAVEIAAEYARLANPDTGS